MVFGESDNFNQKPVIKVIGVGGVAVTQSTE
jgi:hypothetical protein